MPGVSANINTVHLKLARYIAEGLEPNPEKGVLFYPIIDRVREEGFPKLDFSSARNKLKIHFTLLDYDKDERRIYLTDGYDIDSFKNDIKTKEGKPREIKQEGLSGERR